MYSALGRQTLRKRKDPNLKIVVAGCVAAQEGQALLRRVPELDIVMGPHHANRIHELLEQVSSTGLISNARGPRILLLVTLSCSALRAGIDNGRRDEQADLGSQVCAVDPIYIEEDIAVPRRDS